jgi:flagellar biosynthetic protein FlhB
MAGNLGDRTEKPTQKRLKDARERGQVSRSRDLAAALSLSAVTIGLGWFGARMLATLHDRLAGTLATLGDRARDTVEAPALASLVWTNVSVLAVVTGPIALLAAGVTAATSVAQTGWSLSPKALGFHWERLNPSGGLSRLGLKQAMPELAKALVGMLAIGAVGYVLIRDFTAEATGAAGMAPVELARFGWDGLWTLLWRASLAFALLAGGDYALQHWQLMSKLRMTRQEVRDEAKLNEGSPEIKARVRRVQREMSRRRMLQAVKTATVVVTNPTHFAVALEYRRTEMIAPRVVAKGQDHLAARIRALAREHGVPIVENVTLARALHKSAEVGDTIPAALFGAVAEVLAYLVRIKQLVL